MLRYGLKVDLVVARSYLIVVTDSEMKEEEVERKSSQRQLKQVQREIVI